MRSAHGGLEIETIVLLVLGLLVLLLAGAFYTGGFSSLSGKTMEFAAKSAGDSATAGQITNCNRLCGAIASCSDSDQLKQFLTNGCNEMIPCAMAETCVSCDAPEPELC